MPHDDPDLDEVVRSEQSLLDPALRQDGSRVADLLHPDFVEHGASGRVWDRALIVAALGRDREVSGTATDFAPTRLSVDVVLLTYRIMGGSAGNGSLRSSVWVRDRTLGWRLRFHQGTRTAPG